MLGWHIGMLTFGVNDNTTEYYNTTPTTTMMNYNNRTSSTPTARIFACLLNNYLTFKLLNHESSQLRG
jgi:hypothetical protein